MGVLIINGLCRYRKVWSEFFEPVKALNFGIRGDRTQHVLWRIQNGEIPVNVESVVIRCETNNLDKNSPAEIWKGITSIAYAVLKRKPCVNINVTGLLPRDSKGSPRREQICWINEQIEHWCNKLAKKNVLFLKPDSDWTKPNGQLREELYYQDLLHLSEKGNCKFSCAIINILTQKSSKATTNQPPSSPTKTYTTSTTATHINTTDIITTEITSADITGNTLTTGTATIDNTTTDITTTDTSNRDTITTDTATAYFTTADYCYRPCPDCNTTTQTHTNCNIATQHNISIPTDSNRNTTDQTSSNCDTDNKGDPKHKITTQGKIITHKVSVNIITSQTDPIYNITTQAYHIFTTFNSFILNKNFAFKSES